jgi:hypothetical protein
VIPTVWGRGGKNPAFGKDKSKGKSLDFGKDKSKGKSRDMQHSDAVARVARLRRQAGQTQAAPHRMESAWCMVFTDRPTLASASADHEALLVTAPAWRACGGERVLSPLRHVSVGEQVRLPSRPHCTVERTFSSLCCVRGAPTLRWASRSPQGVCRIGVGCALAA